MIDAMLEAVVSKVVAKKGPHNTTPKKAAPTVNYWWGEGRRVGGVGSGGSVVSAARTEERN